MLFGSRLRSVLLCAFVGGCIGSLGGTAWVLIPWTIIGAALGFFSQSRSNALVDGASYGFTLVFLFMSAGYTGIQSVPARLLPFLLFATAGAVYGLCLGIAGFELKRRLRKPGLGWSLVSHQVLSHRTVLIIFAVAAAAALSTSLIHDEYIDSGSRPPGVLSIVVLPSEGLYASGEHQDLKACIYSNYYNPDNQFVQSGWPVRYDYDDMGNHDCRSGFYVIAYACDVIFFSLILYLAILAGKILKRRGLSAKPTIILACITVAAAVAITLGSAKLARISSTATPPPLLSSIAQYGAPFPMPYCSTFNKDVNTICGSWGFSLCAGDSLLPIDYDPSFILFGWPLAYDYSGDSSCSGGESFYPLIFLADAAIYAAVIGGMLFGTNVLVAKARMVK